MNGVHVFEPFGGGARKRYVDILYIVGKVTVRTIDQESNHYLFSCELLSKKTN